MLYSSTTTPSIVTNSKCSQENKTTTTTLRCKLQPPESWNSKGTQNNKIKPLLLNNSRYIQLTRLQPISNQFPTHTVATYYPHKIFVGSLSRMTSPAELATFFRSFGVVIEAKVILDHAGNSKG